jgi:hypothetical protein
MRAKFLLLLRAKAEEEERFFFSRESGPFLENRISVEGTSGTFFSRKLEGIETKRKLIVTARRWT